MFRQSLTLGCFALAALISLPVQADWADEEDGVLYLQADTVGDEYFILQIEDDEVVVQHYSYEDGAVDFEDEDYDLDDIHEIVFHGDSDVDGFFNYTDIPSTAYGFGGDDHLVGGDEDDDLFGGWGRDMLEGNGGNDFMDAGNDWSEGWCIGGEGYDMAYRNYSFGGYTYYRTYQDFVAFDVEYTIYRFPRVINPAMFSTMTSYVP